MPAAKSTPNTATGSNVPRVASENFCFHVSGRRHKCSLRALRLMGVIPNFYSVLSARESGAHLVFTNTALGLAGRLGTKLVREFLSQPLTRRTCPGMKDNEHGV